MATALLLVDVQRNMLEGSEPIPGAVQMRTTLARLLENARASGVNVVHIQNDGDAGDPDLPGTDGWDLVFLPSEDELVVRKSEPNAFGSNPQLAQVLRERGVEHVVVAGMQSEFCVKETSLGALGEGFTVEAPSGAHATYGVTAAEAEALSISVEGELRAAGVIVTSTADFRF